MVVKCAMVLALASGCEAVLPRGGTSGDRLAAAGQADATPPQSAAAGDAMRTVDVRAYAHFAAGVAHALASRWQQALDAFDRAGALDPNSAAITLKRAQCIEHLGRHREAVAAYERAGTLAPDDFTVHFTVGNAYDRRDNLKKAVAAFQRALDAADADKTTAEYAVAVWRLASAADRSDQTDAAIAAYERLLALAENPRPPYRGDRQLWTLVRHPEFICEQIGKLYLDRKNVKAAIAIMERGFAYQPRSLTLTLRLGRVYLDQKLYAKALAAADHLIAWAGHDLTAVDLMIRAARGLKKPEEAVKRLEKYLRADPDNLALRFYLARVYREVKRLPQAEQLLRSTIEQRPTSLAYGELAAVQREAKKPAEAMDTLAEAIDRNQAGREVLLAVEDMREELAADTDAFTTWRLRAGKRPDSAGNQYLLGYVLSDRKQYAPAAAALARALKLQPEFVWAYVELAAVHTRQKQYDAALDVYRKALRTGLGENPMIHRMMARLHERLGRMKDAMAAVDRSIQLAPEDPRGLYLKSAFLDRLGEDKACEKLLRGILVKDPDDATAANALSYFYATRRRNLAEARTLIDRALKQEPKNAAFLDTLGWVLYAQSDYPAALTALEAAGTAILEDVPEGDPVIYDHLGDAYEKLKRYDDARKAWLKALKVNKDDPSYEVVPEKVNEKIERLPE